MLDPKDFEVSQPPSDGISDLDFSSQADFLAVSSWDNQVRIYEVQPSGATIPKAAFSHEAPSLCVSWSKDGTKVVSGGADKAGRMFDIATGQTTQIAQHDDTIKCIKFLEQSNVVATGSWDKTLKYWDLRSPTPVGTVQLPERCYAMDANGPLMVVGTAEKHVCIFDLNNPTVIFKQLASPLKWQTRVVSCFSDSKGFAIGSIEGRVGIQYVEDKDASKNFSFKCHRDDAKNVYAVNDISFHPVHGTFSTCGADGTVSFWDKDSKQRLKPFPKSNGQIACTAFNRNGSIFAYAVSYDWSKGYKQALPSNTNKIYLHAVRDEEIKPRTPKKR
ncbi:WD40-repeat-containing domain protein [Cokeromyces recurvatus]|uniref:WD40-repeat-containing domain protein n=1 Tax=Cokeromyces recurvatus TaxID=90255 RepID=UPI00221E7515|nr:WD40-repeat-containing domain protein [Cokeromyces recurvatus]KAI7898471.1 WD40-repeat-containing domain protein [Cokeromyces recurvatus]